MEAALPDHVAPGGGAPAPTRPDLRERRRRRTLGEVERVAVALFAARGYDAVTVDDIAAAAGISRRTFFRYFSSKEQVLFLDHEERLDAVCRALAARPAAEPAAVALREALLSLVDDLAARSEVARRRRAVVQGEPALAAASFARYRSWETALVEVVAARTGSDPPDDIQAADLAPGVVVAASLGALRVALRAWEASDGEADLRDLLSRALDLLGDGVARPV